MAATFIIFKWLALQLWNPQNGIFVTFGPSEILREPFFFWQINKYISTLYCVN